MSENDNITAEDLVEAEIVEVREDTRNPSFTKKGPGRRHGISSRERRKIRLDRRPGYQPIRVLESRRAGYLHAHARRRLLSTPVSEPLSDEQEQ